MRDPISTRAPKFAPQLLYKVVDAAFQRRIMNIKAVRGFINNACHPACISGRREKNESYKLASKTQSNLHFCDKRYKCLQLLNRKQHLKQSYLKTFITIKLKKILKIKTYLKK